MQNLDTKQLKITDSIQFKYSRANLVSDIVLKIQEEIQPFLQSSSSPSPIQSINLQFPNEVSFAPAPSTLHSPTLQFPDKNFFAPSMQMNVVTVKPMVTDLQAQVTKIQQTMNQMHQMICQSIQQLVPFTYPLNSII